MQSAAAVARVAMEAAVVVEFLMPDAMADPVVEEVHIQTTLQTLVVHLPQLQELAHHGTHLEMQVLQERTTQVVAAEVQEVQAPVHQEVQERFTLETPTQQVGQQVQLLL